MLEQRESLLAAIFDAPDDDTPRLVYADWLDEHGQAAFAELIRLQCGPPDPSGRTFRRLEELVPVVYPGNTFPPDTLDTTDPHRGFLRPGVITVHADDLLDPLAFRTKAATEHPEWFGATSLKVQHGRIVGGVPFETLFTAPATRLVTRLDLSGIIEEIPAPKSDDDDDDEFILTLDEYRYVPVVTVLGVEALARHRSARRLTELDLRYNHLDNDAARLLVRSPYLTRLKRLEISGNDLRGDTWAELLGRFGEDVVT